MSFPSIDPEVKELLMDQEEILLTAKQAKGVPGGSISTPNSIYVTNSRVIFKNPKLFGLTANIIDANYRDISNVRLNRGMFSTEIYLKTRNRADEIKLPAVDKQIAQNVINLIQKGLRGELPNQSRIEKIHQKPSSNSNSTTENNEDLYSKLEKLSDLKQKGALSDSEFQMLKNDILKKMTGKELSTASNDSNVISYTDNVTPDISVNNDISSSYKTCPNSNCNYQNMLTSMYCKECGTKL